MTVRPEIRDYIRNYLGAIDEAQKFAFKNTLTKEINQQTKNILDLMFVYKVSNVNVTKETIEYGMNIIEGYQKRVLHEEVKNLLDNRIIFQGPSGEYEFRRSNLADLDVMLEESKQNILRTGFDISKEVMELAPKKFEEYLEAKGHNNEYQEDKAVKRIFTTTQNLTSKYKDSEDNEISFWEYLENNIPYKVDWKDRYEGIMVYVICETEEDIQNAQHIVKSNNSTKIIAGVPKNPIQISDQIINLLAINSFMDPENDDYSKLEFQEKALVDEILGKEGRKTGQVGEFIKARDQYLDTTTLHWFREDGKTIVADPNNEYEPADVLMKRLFIERNQISHEYINKAHPKRFLGFKDVALREAVTRLIEINHPIEIDQNAKENRGEIRYLRNLLANEGLLQLTGDYKGSIGSYEWESNIQKYQNKLPGLAFIINKLKSLKRGESVTVWEILSETIQEPYGLGPYALCIFLACTIRHFGDELRLKINPATPGYSPTDDPELIIDLAVGNYPGAIIERRFLTPETSQLITDIFNLFSDKPASAGTQQTLSETWAAIKQWREKLTRLEKAVGIYPEENTAHNLVDMLSIYSESNRGSQEFLENLKQIYGYSADADLNKEESKEAINALKADKEEIERKAISIKSTLVNELSQLFNPSGETYIKYQEAITTWYENLHPDQKILNAEWQTPATRTILEAVPKLQDVEKLFLELIPSGPGFSLYKVDDWSFDQTEKYQNIFQDAIDKINTSQPKVLLPNWKSSVEPAHLFDGKPVIKFRGKVTLEISTPEKNAKVRVVKNDNPVEAKQFEIADEKNKIIKEIEESCTYHLVTETDQGDFSRIVHIIFTNEDEGFHLIAETAPQLIPEDREYRFRNPIDKDSLIVLLKSMIERMIEDKLINKNDIIGAFKEILEKLDE